MKIGQISNINFTKKSIGVTKQTIKVFNPEPGSDPEKILVIMTKNPALFCSGGLELRNITMNPARGFVQTAYAPVGDEE